MSNASVDGDTTFAEAIYDKDTDFPPGVNQNPCPKGTCTAH